MGFGVLYPTVGSEFGPNATLRLAFKYSPSSSLAKVLIKIKVLPTCFSFALLKKSSSESMFTTGLPSFMAGVLITP